MPPFMWPAGVEIQSSRIAAGEPITEDLEHDFRDRDDYLLDMKVEGEGIGILFLTGTYEGDAGSGIYEFTLDDSIDWRDRFLYVRGKVLLVPTIPDARDYIPGGNYDEYINDDENGTPDPNECYGEFNQYFYTQNGHADGSALPRIQINPVDQGTCESDYIRIFADIATGNLQLRFHAPATAGNAPDNCAYNLMIIHSIDQGQY